MLERIITGLMLVVALVHVLPISGFFSGERIAALYGIEVLDGNLEILMRHRAILFGMLGAFLAYAAFNPSIQPLAFIAAFISLASFFFLAFSVGNYSDSIHRVVIADVIAALCLLLAIALYIIQARL